MYNNLLNITPHVDQINTKQVKNIRSMENIENFKTKFFEKNSIQLDNLITLLETHEQLTTNHWIEACSLLDKLIYNISKIVR